MVGPGAIGAVHATRVVPYADLVHRDQVVSLWRDAFGYATAHNDPGLAIAAPGRQRERQRVHESLSFSVEPRVSMGKLVT